MLASLLQAFTSRYAGPVGFAIALVMAALLVATTTSAVRTQAQLRARVAELTRENQQVGVTWRARLTACQNAAVETQARGKPANMSDATRARQLAANAPAGFDVCARMESADRAVLESLR